MIKSCIMHVSHNEIHNEERRGSGLRTDNGGDEAGVRGEVALVIRLLMVQTVDQFELAGLNCGLTLVT